MRMQWPREGAEAAAMQAALVADAGLGHAKAGAHVGEPPSAFDAGMELMRGWGWHAYAIL